MVGKTAGVLSTGLGVVSTGLTLYSVYNNFTSPNGDPIKGLLDLAQASVTFYAQVASSCFTGRMLSRTAEGKKRVDAIREGDLVWSRDENDPYGPLVLKAVLATFERLSGIWHVKIPGQTIETTSEHPFWVVGRGWIPTMELHQSDLLLTDEGMLATVEGVEDTRKVESVYNFLVEDFHTYFVSETEEGVSVSAHNYTVKGRLKDAQLPTSGKIRYVPPKGHPPSQPLPRGPNHGYIDRFGNEWVRGPSRTAGQPFEWDVQLGRNATRGMRAMSSDGAHVNVSLDGEVTH